jgi:hypothetical protein
MEAVSCTVPLGSIVLDVGVIETPVTGTKAPEYTVTAQVAVKDPFVVVTTIFAVPAPVAVTMPEESTVARFMLEVDQITAVFVAFAGWTVAVSCRVDPMAKKAVF